MTKEWAERYRIEGKVRRTLCQRCHRPLDSLLWEGHLWVHGECEAVPHYDQDTIKQWVLKALVQAGAVGGEWDGGVRGEGYSLHKQFPGLVEPYADDEPRDALGPGLRDGGQWQYEN